MHLSSEDKRRLKVKGMEGDAPRKCQPEDSGVASFISDKIDFKPER